MEIHNYMEDMVENVLDELLTKRDDAPKDAKSKLDMIAWSLNRLPSKYVVTQKGRVYTKLQEIEVQFKTDVVREVARAIEHIKANPRP